MNHIRKIKITELNPHVICVLCGGYYINATTITECLHSFCRTCITRYLETSKYCPVCDVMVHKTRPLEYIRSDKTLQDLVYKLVPGLYKIEMKRRREYYTKCDSSGVPHPPSEDRGDEFYDRIIYTEDEKISLSLELCADGIPFKTPSTVHGHSGPGNIKIKDVRYLQCPAAFSVSNIKKFIRMKFDLKQKYEIDVFHTAEPLLDYYTLMDIAYIYTWTRRAPLRLYYTVYEHRVKPTLPREVSLAQTNASSDKNIVVMESNQPIKDKCTDSEKENQESGETPAAKRKFPDGPGDISPDLEFEKTRTQYSENRRKDGVPRKRAKKQVVYDSSVLEAMSESEEQLAKLTLDGEEGGKVNANTTGDDAVKKTSVKKNKGKNPDLSSNTEVSTDAETVNAKQINTLKEHEDRVSEIVLSPFRPLNPSIESKDECVFEFKSDNQDKSETPKSTPKAKGKGKKKQVDDNSGKTTDIAPGKDSTDVSLVKSSNHPGMKSQSSATSPKKKISEKQNGEVKQTGKKRGRPPMNKANATDADGKEVPKVKRKYVRKADKKEKALQDKCNQENGNNANNVKESSNGIDRVEVDIKNTNNKQENGKSENCVINKEPEVNGAIENQGGKDSDVKSSSDTNKNKGVFECSKDMDTHPVEPVREPTTPLYGQTPKVMEENQGLPVSPHPDCAETNVVTNGANSQTDIDGKNAAVKNVNKSNDSNKGACVPVSYSVSNSLGLNSSGLKSIGMQSSGSNNTPSSHITLMGYPGYNNCEVGGNSNGFTRNSLPSNIAVYNEAMSPMSPSSVCVIGPYQRINDTHVHSGQVTNGYSDMDQNSDQPLDLTNNGHRDEYMKGKIFKTKLLKKTYSKADNVPPQKDKSNTQNNNGLIPGSWI